MNKYQTLKEVFGYESFREGQEPIIDDIVTGRDTLAIMPTGAGKSICYQIPALMLPGIALVVSPLISLMKDQVGALNQAGVHAAYLNSTLTPGQYRKALSLASEGVYSIIYVAPERLMTDSFLQFAMEAPISMISIDEAHCVSQWGQDFRPSYLKISQFIELLPRRPVVCAFTATATPEVKEDIRYLLKLVDPLEVTTGFDRKNLYFEVQKPTNKDQVVFQYIDDHQDKSGIIYCATRKSVEELTAKLINRGILAASYHAGLPDRERSANQDAFLYDERPVMVATNAFGMGIDKSNVSYVIHYNMPKNLESYYQEAGRAGRDGEPADCILLYEPKDVVINQFFIDQIPPNEEMDPASLRVVQASEREKLKQMTFYCHTSDCLREYMLRYFGERPKENCCNHCSNCNQHFVEEDITQTAQHVIQCVRNCGQRYGVVSIEDCLRGMDNDKVRRFGLKHLETYGIEREINRKKLRDIINFLLLKEYLITTNSEYPVLQLGETANELLHDTASLIMRFPKEEPKVKKEPSSKPRKKASASAAGSFEAAGPMDDNLFEQLRTLRKEIAAANKVPPYIVFADAALHDMCRKLPVTPDQFLQVAGVGQMKLEKYGEDFLKAIQAYKNLSE